MEPQQPDLPEIDEPMNIDTPDGKIWMDENPLYNAPPSAGTQIHVRRSTLTCGSLLTNAEPQISFFSDYLRPIVTDLGLPERLTDFTMERLLPYPLTLYCGWALKFDLTKESMKPVRVLGGKIGVESLGNHVKCVAGCRSQLIICISQIGYGNVTSAIKDNFTEAETEIIGRLFTTKGGEWEIGQDKPYWFLPSDHNLRKWVWTRYVQSAPGS